ncbi:hypothetical protein TRICI_004811 [Trichomonascus ciferrii]|uniref:Uncharacterized protein n=1 Tax=Trichomonascus ciferrii TaxID=44093 RepID=A0A642V406_9ASCO|nr:hypothetical protein TRICI_004811 [Trichomonascus ciferrii]
MPKFKRPEPLQIVPNDEFESFRRLRPRARITPTTATTPSVAVYGRDNFKQLCTPTCVSLYFESPRSARFREDPIDENERLKSGVPTPRSNHGKFPPILPAAGTAGEDEVTVIKINPEHASSGVIVRANNQTFNIVVDSNQKDSLSTSSERFANSPHTSTKKTSNALTHVTTWTVPGASSAFPNGQSGHDTSSSSIRRKQSTIARSPAAKKPSQEKTPSLDTSISFMLITHRNSLRLTNAANHKTIKKYLASPSGLFFSRKEPKALGL